jgi:DNA-binding transcriptional MerR regulator
MHWRLPGTILSIDRADAATIEKQFSSMFLGGGIVLSQVAGITGLEPYTIQNWVKRGFLPPPDHKRYNLNQLCRIININLLKRSLLMEQIVGLLSYINGSLSDTSDDIIDDSQLYFLFVKLAASAPSLRDPNEANASIEALLQDYQEPIPGAKERVAKVMKVMVTAWAAARLHDAANRMAAEL